MFSRYIRKESLRTVGQSTYLRLYNVRNSNVRKISFWSDWKNLPNKIDELTEKLEKIDISTNNLKKEISSSTTKLENTIQQVYGNIRPEEKETKKADQSNSSGDWGYSYLRDIFKPFLSAALIAGLSILYSRVSDKNSLPKIPENTEEFLEKNLPGVIVREKLFIKPEIFDTNTMVERSGTQRLESFINTKLSAGKKVFSLTGPAGSGKSEMALEYANIMWNKFEKNFPDRTRIVQIIHSENNVVFEEEYISFAKKLNIATDNKDIPEIKKEVNDILDLYSNWILIFDNVNEYKDIKDFIPKSGKGQVILTKRTNEELFENNVERIDVTSVDYRISDKEALNIFELKMPNLSSEQKNQILSLAYKLLYSPLALKRAADLIISGQSFDSVVTKIDNFKEKKLGLDNNQKYEHNLLQLNKELIELLPVDAKALLAVILYSNPDYTHTILDMSIDLKSICNFLSFCTGSIRKETEIMSELKSKDIVSGYRGDKTHRSMRKAFSEVINKNETDILNVVAPIYKNIKMSNYFKSDVLNNAPIMPHIQSFFELVVQQKDSNDKLYPDLYLDAIFMLRNLGTQFVSSDSGRAKKYLGQAKEELEKFVNVKGAQKSDYEINPKNYENPSILLSKLKEHNKILGNVGKKSDGSFDGRDVTDLYAGILYQLGRIYFHTKDDNSKKESKAYLTCAEYLANNARNIEIKNSGMIGKRNSDYDENMGFVFKQNGLLFIELEGKYNKEELQSRVKVYDAISRDQCNTEINKLEDRDYRSIITCYAAQARAKIKLYELLSDKQYLKDANSIIENIFLIIESEEIKEINKLIPNKHLETKDHLSKIQKLFKGRFPEFYNLKGELKLFENDFDQAKLYFEKTCNLIENEGKLENQFLAEAYLGRAKADIKSLTPFSLRSTLGKAQDVYNIEPFIDASIKVQEKLARADLHPKMNEALDWKNLVEELRNAELYKDIEAKYTVQVMCVNEIKYDNSLLNCQNLINEVLQIEGAKAFNDLTEMGKDMELAETIIEASKEYGAKYIANILFISNTVKLESNNQNMPMSSLIGVRNIKLIQNDIKYDISNEIILSSFTAKEAIEGLPIIKYFVKEILHIQYEFPCFVDSNSFKIVGHFMACNIGMLGISGKVSTAMSVVSTMIYGSKVLAYDYMFQQKQITFQNTEEKSIDTLYEFVEKCGLDIATQTSIGVFSSTISGSPIIYDIAISTTMGGVQCYNLYNQAAVSKSQDSSIIRTAVPYIVDVSTLYIVSKNLHYNVNTLIGQMIAVKQGFVILSSVVAADYICKILLSSVQETINKIEEEYIDSVLQYIGGSINYIYEN